MDHGASDGSSGVGTHGNAAFEEAGRHPGRDINDEATSSWGRNNRFNVFSMLFSKEEGGLTGHL